MDRRAFIGTLAGSLLAVPLAAEAQQPGQVWRIGVLESAPGARVVGHLRPAVFERLLSGEIRGHRELPSRG
jgi:hypothetical protein